MNEELKKYYEYLKGAKADVPPDFDSFAKTLADETQAKTYFDYLKANKFDAPDTFDSFSETLGLKKKDLSGTSLDSSPQSQVVSQSTIPQVNDSSTPPLPSKSTLKKTILSPEDESKFQQWKQGYLENDMYDFRGFYENERAIGELKPSMADYLKEDPDFHFYSIGLDGRVLKAKEHETHNKTIDAETKLGNELYVDAQGVERIKPKTAKTVGEWVLGGVKAFDQSLASLAGSLDYVHTSASDAINQIILGKEDALTIKKMREDKIFDPVLNPVRPFQAIEDAINYAHSGAKPLPETIPGQIVGGAMGVVPTIVASLYAPELQLPSIFAKLGLKEASKFGLILGAEGAIQGAEKAETGGVVQRLGAPMLGAIEGYFTGSMFDGIGQTSAKIGKNIADKIIPKVVTQGQAINKGLVEQGGSMLSNAIIFGGYGNAEEYLRTGTISAETFATNAGMGIALGIREPARLLYAKGLNAFIATPKEAINRMIADKTTTEEFSKEAQVKIDAIEKGDSPNREGDLAAAKLNANLANLNAIVDEIRSDKEGVIKSIQDSEIEPKAKELIIDKINEVDADNDPKIQATKEVNDKIAKIDEALQLIRDNKSWDETRKEVESAPLKERKLELKEQSLKAYGVEPKEQPKGEDGKVKEKPKAVQTESSKKLLDEIDKPIKEEKPQTEEDIYKGLSNQNRNGVKFAEALPKIMDEAFTKQKPYKDTFLKRKGLTEDEFNNLSQKQKDALQEEWGSSSELKELLGQPHGQTVQPDVHAAQSKENLPIESTEKPLAGEVKPKSWMDFISHNRRMEMSESLKRMTPDELLKVRKSYEKYLKPFAPYGQSDIRSGRAKVNEIDEILDAHKKAEEFNANLAKEKPFDYTSIFEPPTKEETTHYEEQKDNELEQEYQKSFFDKKWAKTRTEAIDKTLAKIKKAEETITDWSSRVYKKSGGKTVEIGKDNDFNLKSVDVDKVNEKRRKQVIDGAKQDIEDAKKDLTELKYTETDKSKELPLQENIPNTGENKPVEALLPQSDSNIPPTGDNATTTLKQGENGQEKALLNRMHNAENLSGDFKKGVEEKGLTYEQISNAKTAEDVDYLIGKNGLNESEKIVLNVENNIEPRIRALAATRLVNALDGLAEKADTPAEEYQYRNRAITIADFIDKQGRRWGEGIQMFNSAEVNSILKPKTQVIRIKRVVRGQRDSQIENNREDIDKKKADLTDANDKSVGEVIGSREYEELKQRVAELEKKLKEEPKTPKPPKEKPTSEFQAKIKKEQDYRKIQWEVFKKGTETTSTSAIGLSKEQIEALGNIVGSYVREGATRIEDLIDRLKKDYLKNTGKLLSDDDARKALPEKVDGKLLTDIEAEGEIKESAEKLASRINRMLEDPKVPKDDPIKQMINTLFEKAKEKDTKEKIPVEKKSALDKIRESLTDKKKYAEVWEQAKEEVLLKIETNEELSEAQKSEYNKRLANFYNEIIGKPFSEKQVETATKAGLKNMDVSIDKIVREHYTVYDATKRTLQEKLVSELGLDGESAKLLSDAVGKQFDKIAIARKKSILKQGVTAKELVHPKVTKQLHDKLIELSNLGAFSDADFAEAYADKWGFPKLDEVQIKEIEKLAKAVQDAPEGYQKFEKTQDLLAYTENIKGIDMGDVYMSMWYSSILSGYRTQAKNFVQNTITSLFEGAVSTIRHPTYTLGLMEHLGSGWGEGLRQFGHIMKTGYNPIKGYKVEVPNVQERFTFKGGNANPANWGKYVTRIMVAADAFSYAGLKEMRSYEVAMNMARQLNKDATEPTKGTWAKATELLNKTSERVKVAEQTATTEGLSGVEYKRRVWELMEQGRSKEMVEDAAHFAARGTFNYSPEGTIGMITESISHLTQSAAIKIKVPFSEKEFTVRPGKFIVPFTRIIANVTNMALDYYPPVGLSRAALGGIGAKGFEGSPLTAKFYRKYTPEERQKVLIKAMMGVASTIGLYLLTEPDDKDESAIEITANGYGDYQKNYELKEVGWQPYSIKIGGKWVSYQYTPLVLALAPLGYYRDMQKYKKDKFDEEKVLQNISLSYFKGLQVVNDISALGSINTLMSAFGAKEPGQAQSYIKNLATSTAKGFIYPKLAEQITQVIDAAQKNPRHDASDLMGKIMRDMPIVRNNYNVMLNAVGEPVLYDPIAMIGNVKSDPFWEYVISKNITIGKPDAKQVFYDDVTKTERAMSNQEYYDFVLKTGKEIKERIENEVIKISLPEDEVAKEITNIKTDARNKFKTELFGWGQLRQQHPDDWTIMKENDALQIPKSSVDLTIGKEKVRIGQEKGVPSKELEEFNNIAMEEYRKRVITYLRNKESVKANKAKINPITEKSRFEDKIDGIWQDALATAKSKAEKTEKAKKAKGK